MSFDLALLDVIRLRLRVEMGRHFADRLDRALAVGDVDNMLGIEPVLSRPRAPDARDARRGVDQHSVQVEQDGLASK